jgi:hypothetical protein
MERNRHVGLNFHLFLPGGKTLIVYPQTIGIPDEFIAHAKDRFVAKVLEMIHQQRPEAILLVMEIWLKRIPFSGDKAQDEADLERMMQRGVEAEPDREEGIVFYYETPDSVVPYLSWITTDGGERTLLPPEQRPVQHPRPSRMGNFYQKAREYADRRDR